MKMFVDGEFVDSHTGATFDVFDPASGERIESVPKGDREDVRSAVDVAERAFAKWSERPAGERSRLLFKISELVRREAEELAKSLTNEQGKPLGEAKSEVNSFANTCEYYAGLTGRLRGAHTHLSTGEGYFIVTKRPIGVVGAILPWNFPVSLMGWKLGPGLADGSTFVVKTASSTRRADLELAVEGAAWGRFRNCGQSCTSVKRLFLFEKIASEFTERLVRKVKTIRLGPGLDPKTHMGPLHNAEQREKVESMVEDAKVRGAKVLTGGKRPKGEELERGYFYEPALLADVDYRATMAREECFGPALPIFVVKDMDEALERANDTIYGLGSSVWTS